MNDKELDNSSLTAGGDDLHPTAMVAIRVMEKNPEAPLSEELWAHIDDCEECQLALMRAIDIGLQTSGPRKSTEAEATIQRGVSHGPERAFEPQFSGARSPNVRLLSFPTPPSVGAQLQPSRRSAKPSVLSVAATVVVLIVSGTSYLAWTLGVGQARDHEVHIVNRPPKPGAESPGAGEKGPQIPGKASKDSEVVFGDHVMRGADGSYWYAKKLDPLVVAVLEGKRSYAPGTEEAMEKLRGSSEPLGTGGPSGELVTLQSPVGQFALASSQEFRWKAAPNATSLKLTIQTAISDPVATVTFTKRSGKWAVAEYLGDSQKPVDQYTADTASPWSMATKGRLPALEPGGEYRWFVEDADASKQDDQASQERPEIARFKVISKEAAAEIARGEIDYADSPLILGAVYKAHGLIDKARRAWDRDHSQTRSSELLRGLPPLPE